MDKLIFVALAVFAVWEYLGTIAPFKVTPKVSPIIVTALAYGLSYLDGRVLMGLAATGVAAIIHKILFSDQEDKPALVWRRKRSSGTVVPPGVGSRIPPL